MNWLDRFYQAAARAGMLVEARWQPSAGLPEEVAGVAFVSPAESILDGLGVSANTSITFPASQLVGLAARDAVVDAIPDAVGFR